jgi:hypothetical protein
MYTRKKYTVHTLTFKVGFLMLYEVLLRFLLNAYKEAIALIDDENRSSKEISDKEVYSSLVDTFF